MIDSLVKIVVRYLDKYIEEIKDSDENTFNILERFKLI